MTVFESVQGAGQQNVQFCDRMKKIDTNIE